MQTLLVLEYHYLLRDRTFFIPSFVQVKHRYSVKPSAVPQVPTDLETLLGRCLNSSALANLKLEEKLKSR